MYASCKIKTVLSGSGTSSVRRGGGLRSGRGGLRSGTGFVRRGGGGSVFDLLIPNHMEVWKTNFC